MPIRPTARPPIDASSCDELAGAERKACRRLGKEFARYVAKAQHESDVLDSLRVTVERASAAAQSDDQRALKKQLRAADKRSGQVQAAQRGRLKAGAKMAAILTDAGVTGLVSEEQFTQIVTYILGQLTQQGLAESEARELLGDSITPAPVDPIAVLGQV